MSTETGGLDLRSVTCRFGGVTAMNGVSFRLRPGEVVGLVGPNGAGKSTLIQVVTGFVRPDSGTILLDGARIDGMSPEDIASRGIARTFQTSRVFPGLTVWDSVLVGTQSELIGRRPHERRVNPVVEVASAFNLIPSQRRRQRDLEERALSVLALFGERLLPRRAHLASSLSYANRRRLDIARALVSEPLVLLLDEPTAGMNPTESAQLAAVIKDLAIRRPTLALMVVEHKMDVVRSLCERVLVMNQGELLADGAPGDVLGLRAVVEAYLGKQPIPTGTQS